MNNLGEKGKISPKDLDRLKRFRLMDDIFMMACFDGYVESAQLLLRIILGRDDLKVTNVATQKRRLHQWTRKNSFCCWQ